VAGVPVVGGPNAAVRDALREASQREVTVAGGVALAAAVREALEPTLHERLARAATGAGEGLTWEAVLPAWVDALMRA
jgi:tRNA A37 threonylcarbamoyltransferase TsaD